MVQSFFCFRLSTAAVWIGWLGAVSYTILSILNIVCLANVDEIVKILTNGTNETNYIVPDVHFKNAETAKLVLLTVLVIYLVLNLQNAFASILLVAGTLKEKHRHLIPWLINNGIYVTYLLLIYVSVLVHLFAMHASVGDIILYLIYMFIGFGLQFYVWLAIYSLFKEFQYASDRERLIPATGSAHPSYTKI